MNKSVILKQNELTGHYEHQPGDKPDPSSLPHIPSVSHSASRKNALLLDRHYKRGKRFDEVLLRGNS